PLSCEPVRIRDDVVVEAPPGVEDHDAGRGRASSAREQAHWLAADQQFLEPRALHLIPQVTRSAAIGTGRIYSRETQRRHPLPLPYRRWTGAPPPPPGHPQPAARVKRYSSPLEDGEGIPTLPRRPSLALATTSGGPP